MARTIARPVAKVSPGTCATFRKQGLIALVRQRHLVEARDDGGKTPLHDYVVTVCGGALRS